MFTKKITYFVLLITSLLLFNPVSVQAETKDASDIRIAWPVTAQNVVWDSPSTGAKGSMPVGNGDIGLNVWVEESGDLVFLIGKTDSFDEFNRLLKIGRVRVRTTPALFQPGMTFSQALRLEDGAIEIKSGDTAIRVWVDANHPIAQVDLKSPTLVEVQVLADNWRKENRALVKGEDFSFFGMPQNKKRVNADTVLPKKADQIGWCHHNVESPWQANLELTALGAEIANGKDLVLNRSFGALLRADGAVAVSDTELKTSSPIKNLSLRIITTTQFANSPQEWERSVNAKFDAVVKLADSDRFTAHQAWWREFWNRSWIKIDALSLGVVAPTGVALPVNSHAWTLGASATGGATFGGEIAGASISGKSLSLKEIAALATAPRPDPSPGIASVDSKLMSTCTLSAWIKPTARDTGRILDKCTAGKSDGLIFDVYPGLSLRWIVGSRLLNSSNCLKANEWQHVAARVDARGDLALFVNGKHVAGKQEVSPEVDDKLPKLSVGESITRAYTLQRFLTACSGRGSLPIKFNGTIFTVDGHDPDFRNWGGHFWFQNTRLPYWGMLYAGDYDMMLPFFNMYRQALPLREAATKKYYGHAGAFYPEAIYFWGNYVDGDYGLNRKGKKDGEIVNNYVRYHWTGAVELVVMMLDYYEATQNESFRDQTLLPLAKSIVTFYDQHWPRVNGKILFDPAMALETWWTATNPMPEIAGLHYLLPRLMKLSADAADKDAWKKTLADLPPVPTATKDGKIRLAPAETFINKKNVENPELYSIFPFRLYTAMSSSKEMLDQAMNAWRVRLHPEDTGWQQNCLWAAMLGLADEAKTYVAGRAANTAAPAGYRFPGFFGPSYNWVPDGDHSVFVAAAQRMLMQCEGERIALLPAWPADWDVNFKLHAPMKTTVECEFRKGKIIKLVVQPESRRKDITMPDWLK